ncbi:MAG: DNA adenine methylase [Actinobacteria bacterium]|nr:DNA adenine methylase [Actinomycetota bacterium]
MSVNYVKAPWPWFGGKADAAPQVWAALGDVDHYVEPFAGSLAVLLRRPHPCNRSYYSETVNDLDGLLVNAWRSIQLAPDAVADAASWPVSEADLHARHLALVRWKSERQLERLMGDPLFHDPVMAGWWMWGQSSWIGSCWCSGTGPWAVGDDGRIEKTRGGGVGVARQLPHLSNDGQGVNHAGTREPGVDRKRPHIGNDGQGVNRPQLREPGVDRKRPHLSDGGQGVNHAGTREPGVARQLPHLSNDGQGVNHAGTREPGVERNRPHLGNGGQGVNRPQLREPGVSESDSDDHPDYHQMTMPELTRWMRFLSARLRHVRILNGDWKRAVTNGATKSLRVRMGGAVGIFVDPPYSAEAERAALYAEEDFAVAHAVREWAIVRGADKDTRIVLAGFDGEHNELEAIGWRSVEWYRAGFLRGGMSNASKTGEGQQHRERLWLSPHCLVPVVEVSAQVDMFGGAP